MAPFTGNNKSVAELQMALDAIEQRVEKGNSHYTDLAKELPRLGDAMQEDANANAMLDEIEDRVSASAQTAEASVR